VKEQQARDSAVWLHMALSRAAAGALLRPRTFAQKGAARASHGNATAALYAAAGVAAACARASVQPLRVRPLIAAHGAEGAGAAAATAEASGAAHTGGFGARGYGARALEPVFGLHAAQMMTMNEKNISCYAKKHWVETLHFGVTFCRQKHEPCRQKHGAMSLVLA
jgi:hypothetical protein